MKSLSTRPSIRARATDRGGEPLLDAARAAFLEEGLSGLSLRRVAERAGCTTMAVYTRFGGKQGLVEALYDEGFARLREAQARVPAGVVGAERVVALCHAYRTTAHAFPHHYALMLGRTSGSFEPSLASRERSLGTLDPLIDAVEGTLPRARSAALRRDRATALAHRLLAFCHGWVSMEQVGFPFGSDDARRASFEAGVRAVLSSA